MAAKPNADLRLPSAPDIERLVLGQCLLSAEALTEATEFLEDSDFSTDIHRRTWTAIRTLRESHETIDYVLLATQLSKLGWLEAVGGLAFLMTLTEGMPIVPALTGHLRVLRDKAGLRRLMTAAQTVVEKAQIGEQSPGDLLDQIRPTFDELENSNIGKGDGGQTAIEVFESFPGGLDVFLDPTKQPKGLPTGFSRYDDMTGGLYPGEVTIIAAATSQGKTALALNILEHVTLDPRLQRHVAMFSLEMSAPRLLQRLVCARARVDQYKFRNGYTNEEERHRLQHATAEIADAHLRFYEQGGISAIEIGKRIRTLAKHEGLALAVVDYLQLIGSHTAREENRNQVVSQISRMFVMLAKECGIPIILLSQLSRAYSKRTDPRPQLSDLRDSGSIEQDASVVAFIYREEVYRRDREDLRGIAELILAKQRNGATGTIPLRFLGNIGRFESRADDRPPEE